MHALKAHVRGGRLLLDEPTDLPEGVEVDLIAVDDADFDPADRARLLEAIDDGEHDVERGDLVDGLEFADALLVRREASPR